MRDVRAVARHRTRDIHLVETGRLSESGKVSAQCSLLLGKLWRLTNHPDAPYLTPDQHRAGAQRNAGADEPWLTCFLTGQLTDCATGSRPQGRTFELPERRGWLLIWHSRSSCTGV
jgi:hypothetical protein